MLRVWGYKPKRQPVRHSEVRSTTINVYLKLGHDWVVQLMEICIFLIYQHYLNHCRSDEIVSLGS